MVSKRSSPAAATRYVLAGIWAGIALGRVFLAWLLNKRLGEKAYSIILLVFACAFLGVLYVRDFIIDAGASLLFTSPYSSEWTADGPSSPSSSCRSTARSRRRPRRLLHRARDAQGHGRRRRARPALAQGKRHEPHHRPRCVPPFLSSTASSLGPCSLALLTESPYLLPRRSHGLCAGPAPVRHRRRARRPLELARRPHRHLGRQHRRLAVPPQEPPARGLSCARTWWACGGAARALSAGSSPSSRGRGLSRRARHSVRASRRSRIVGASLLKRLGRL